MYYLTIANTGFDTYNVFEKLTLFQKDDLKNMHGLIYLNESADHNARNGFLSFLHFVCISKIYHIARTFSFFWISQ